MKKKLFAIFTSIVVMCSMLTISSYAETEEVVTTPEENVAEEPASTHDSGVSVDIPVTVTWDDTNAESTPDKPDSVEVSLTDKDGNKYTTTVSPDADNNWKGNFEGVNPYNEDGTLKEFTVDGDDLKADYGYNKESQKVENKGVNLDVTNPEKLPDCKPDRSHELNGADIAIAKKTDSIKDDTRYYIWTKFDTSNNDTLKDLIIKAIEKTKFNGLGNEGTPVTKDNTVFKWGSGENAEYAITDSKGNSGIITVQNDEIAFSGAEVWSLVFTLNAIFTTDTEAGLPYEYIATTEPTEPTDPVDPTDPTEPTDPTVPTDPTEPTTPVEPTEPTIPVEPTIPEPTEPIIVAPTEPDTTIAPTETTATTDAPQATTSPSVTKDTNPKTGDSNMSLYFGIMALAAAAVFTTVLLSGRRRDS